MSRRVSPAASAVVIDILPMKVIRKKKLWLKIKKMGCLVKTLISEGLGGSLKSGYKDWLQATTEKVQKR